MGNFCRPPTLTIQGQSRRDFTTAPLMILPSSAGSSNEKPRTSSCWYGTPYTFSNMSSYILSYGESQDTFVLVSLLLVPRVNWEANSTQVPFSRFVPNLQIHSKDPCLLKQSIWGSEFFYLFKLLRIQYFCLVEFSDKSLKINAELLINLYIVELEYCTSKDEITRIFYLFKTLRI